MAAVAIAIIRIRSLFAVVMLSGVYSLLAASMFVGLDAVDVAFTEAAVGAGISTVLMLGVLTLTRSYEKIPVHTPLLPLLVVFLTGGVLIYATLDMPAFGDPNAPANLHVAPRYLLESGQEIGLPNVVTSVLASYRGYDTLGEVTVIFTAAIAVTMLLAGRAKFGPAANRRPGNENENKDENEADAGGAGAEDRQA
jgi:multicomponent Na+:H+ antiporter subunit B